MPTISMFYGIIIRMLFMDKQQHHLPHLHVEYQGKQAVISIPDGNLLEGDFPEATVHSPPPAPKG